MDAHGWNLAEMCQRYHQAVPAVQNSSTARDGAAAIVGAPVSTHLEQASPSYTHYT